MHEDASSDDPGTQRGAVVSERADSTPSDRNGLARGLAFAFLGGDWTSDALFQRSAAALDLAPNAVQNEELRALVAVVIGAYLRAPRDRLRELRRYISNVDEFDRLIEPDARFAFEIGCTQIDPRHRKRCRRSAALATSPISLVFPIANWIGSPTAARSNDTPMSSPCATTGIAG